MCEVMLLPITPNLKQKLRTFYLCKYYSSSGDAIAEFCIRYLSETEHLSFISPHVKAAVRDEAAVTTEQI